LGCNTTENAISGTRSAGKFTESCFLVNTKGRATSSITVKDIFLETYDTEVRLTNSDVFTLITRATAGIFRLEDGQDTHSGDTGAWGDGTTELTIDQTEHRTGEITSRDIFRAFLHLERLLIQAVSAISDDNVGVKATIVVGAAVSGSVKASACIAFARDHGASKTGFAVHNLRGFAGTALESDPGGLVLGAGGGGDDTGNDDKARNVLLRLDFTHRQGICEFSARSALEEHHLDVFNFRFRAIFTTRVNTLRLGLGCLFEVGQELGRVVYESMSKLRCTILRMQEVAQIHAETVFGTGQLITAMGK
jgi:hypothetical protein